MMFRMGYFSTYVAETSPDLSRPCTDILSSLHKLYFASYNPLHWLASHSKCTETQSCCPRKHSVSCFITGWFSTVSHSQLPVSTQEAEPPVTSAVCNGDLEASRGEHVRRLRSVALNDSTIDWSDWPCWWPVLSCLAYSRWTVDVALSRQIDFKVSEPALFGCKQLLWHARSLNNKHGIIWLHASLFRLQSNLNKLAKKKKTLVWGISMRTDPALISSCVQQCVKGQYRPCIATKKSTDSSLWVWASLLELIQEEMQCTNIERDSHTDV